MPPLLTALLMLQPLQPVTLSEALSMSPEQAGDRILASQPHGPIVALEMLPQKGMNPPGYHEVELHEAVVELPAGCHRPAWHATFIHGPHASKGSAIPKTVYPKRYVGLKAGENCHQAKFVEAGGTLSAPDALAALNTLALAALQKQPVRAGCRDETKSDLCRDGVHLRRELKRLSAWLVTNQKGSTEIWLGTPGQTITVVHVAKEHNLISMVERYVPAPF